MIIIISIVLGVFAYAIAEYKGFKPLRWLITVPIVGLVVVSLLPKVEKEGVSSEEADKRLENADKVGAWMAGINVGLFAVLVVIDLS